MATSVTGTESRTRSSRVLPTDRMSRQFRNEARRHPFIALVLIVIVSNGVWTVFSFGYNSAFIVDQHMNPAQREVFWGVASLAYNTVAYPLGIGLLVYLMWPLVRCRRQLREQRAPNPQLLERSRKRLINLPTYVFLLVLGLWLPGAIVFPLLVCGLGGSESADAIWFHFSVSFVVSALLTSVQTWFFFEQTSIALLYPLFFRKARPARMVGVFRIPFRVRLVLLWFAAALMPLVALWAVALNFIYRPPGPEDTAATLWLATSVAWLGVCAAA